MAEVVLFHHSCGKTAGFLAFADELRDAGHTVHTPDLFDGRTFASWDESRRHVAEIGNYRIIGRGVQAAMLLPSDVVYAGFALGVLPAQWLAQTRPGARGALLFPSCLREFGPIWPAGVPVQFHAMKDDPVWVDDGDLDAARAIVESADDAELFLYPGDQRLFADSSLPSYDPGAAALLTERVLKFLAAL